MTRKNNNDPIKTITRQRGGGVTLKFKDSVSLVKFTKNFLLGWLF